MAYLQQKVVAIVAKNIDYIELKLTVDNIDIDNESDTHTSMATAFSHTLRRLEYKQVPMADISSLKRSSRGGSRVTGRLV